jgi:hypothetical protein
VKRASRWEALARELGLYRPTGTRCVQTLPGIAAGWDRRDWPRKLNFKAVQIKGIGQGEELSLLDKLMLRPRLENQVGVGVEDAERLIERI